MADFDWKVIVGPLAKIGAPVLGGIIGGPGGAAMGKAAGGILAEALGVDPDPQSVADAIEANPDAAPNAVNSPDMAAIIAEELKALQTVNETYRIELQNESWVVRLWRPICGWCLALVWTVHGLAIGKAIWVRDFETIKAVADLLVFYTVMGAVTGTIAYGRTKEKLAGVSDGAGAIAETLAAAVKKVVKK